MKKTLDYLCSADYEKHRQAILMLCEAVQRRNAELQFDSYYRGNPAGSPLLGLCYDGERLVGQENYISQNISIGGELYAGAMSVDTLVHPDYRLFHGVFGKLCKLTMDHMKGKADFLFTLANEESKKYYIKYFNWNVTSKIGVYKKMVRVAFPDARSLLAVVKPGKLFSDLVLERVEEFSEELLEPVFREGSKSANYARFHKTSSYLNWKYLNNRAFPGISGYIISSKGCYVGYVVVYDNWGERKILDFTIMNDDSFIFKKMLLSLSKLAAQKGLSQISIHATPEAWYRPFLHDLVFFKRGEIDFLTNNIGGSFPDTRWVVHCGDFDVF